MPWEIGARQGKVVSNTYNPPLLDAWQQLPLKTLIVKLITDEVISQEGTGPLSRRYRCSEWAPGDEAMVTQ
jgi:hypothetical protein